MNQKNDFRTRGHNWASQLSLDQIKKQWINYLIKLYI